MSTRYCVTYSLTTQHKQQGTEDEVRSSGCRALFGRIISDSSLSNADRIFTVGAHGVECLPLYHFLVYLLGSFASSPLFLCPLNFRLEGKDYAIRAHHNPGVRRAIQYLIAES